MKRDVMRKWVKALRSGKYKQTTGVLKNELGYCCLGVLCDIKAKEQKKKFNGIGDEDEDVLSVTQMKWAGMKTKDGKCGNNKLTFMNDYKGRSFAYIADFIEANYKKL